jgi:hypothetical protein
MPRNTQAAKLCIPVCLEMSGATRDTRAFPGFLGRDALQSLESCGRGWSVPSVTCGRAWVCCRCWDLVVVLQGYSRGNRSHLQRYRRVLFLFLEGLCQTVCWEQQPIRLDCRCLFSLEALLCALSSEATKLLTFPKRSSQWHRWVQRSSFFKRLGSDPSSCSSF